MTAPTTPPAAPAAPTAPAKAPGAKRGKKVVESEGIAHISATFNNLLITITDLRGNALASEAFTGIGCGLSASTSALGGG